MQNALVAMSFVALGGLIAACVRLLRLPDRLHAAILADAELRAENLLATAWAVGRRGPDPFHAAVVAKAEGFCRSIRPADVSLRRFSTGAWVGVSLAFLMIGTLAALLTPGDQTSSEAAGRVRSAAAKLDSSNDGTSHPQSVNRSAMRSAEDRPIATTVTPTSESGDSTLEAETSTNPDSDQAGQAEASGDQRGSGEGASRTDLPDKPRPTSPTAGSSAPQSAAADASTDASTGGRANPATQNTGRSGGVASGESDHSSRGLTTINDAKGSEEERGETSAAAHRGGAYRDLVAEFFTQPN